MDEYSHLCEVDKFLANDYFSKTTSTREGNVSFGCLSGQKLVDLFFNCLGKHFLVTVGVKKTVTFSFRSVPLERKRSARAISRKQFIPFPTMVIERRGAEPLCTYVCVRARVLVHSGNDYSTAV